VEDLTLKYGRVYREVGSCKDDYSNIETMKNYRKASGLAKWRRRRVFISGQQPMLKAIRAAEADLGREIVVTGSLRTCALQSKLYASDHNRYAPPWVGLHCQGLAIDVTTEDAELKTKVRKALEAVGFTQARQDDEPWHFSFGWTA
jgi:hypothetical protein